MDWSRGGIGPLKTQSISKSILQMSIGWKYSTLYYLLSEYPGIVQQKQVLSRSYMDVSKSCHLKWITKFKKAIE